MYNLEDACVYFYTNDLNLQKISAPNTKIKLDRQEIFLVDWFRV